MITPISQFDREKLANQYGIHLLADARPTADSPPAVAAILDKLTGKPISEYTRYESSMRELFREHPANVSLGGRLVELFTWFGKSKYALDVAAKLKETNGPQLRVIAYLLLAQSEKTHSVLEFLNKDLSITSFKPTKDGGYYAEDFLTFELGVIIYYLHSGKIYQGKKRLERLLEIGFQDDDLVLACRVLREVEPTGAFAQMNKFKPKEVIVKATKKHYLDYEWDKPFFHHEREMNRLLEAEEDEVDAAFVQALISLPRATITADLLTAVRDVIVSQDKYVEANTWPTVGMLHALFLLWHLGETEAALDALLEVLRSDDEYQDFLFGVKTEDWLREILDLLGKDHPEKLAAFVREPYRNSYVRSTVMHAVGRIALRDESRRAEILPYYYELLEELLHPDLPAGLLDTNFISFAVGELIEFKDGEKSVQLLKKFFDRDLIDPSIQGDLYEIEFEILHGKQKKRSLFNLPSDIEDYFSGEYRRPNWDSPVAPGNFDYTAFTPPIDKLLFRLRSKGLLARPSSNRTPPTGTKLLATPGKKVGRNEPCPCGSGKKYKQCCLKK